MDKVIYKLAKEKKYDAIMHLLTVQTAQQMALVEMFLKHISGSEGTELDKKVVEFENLTMVHKDAVAKILYEHFGSVEDFFPQDKKTEE